jgi:hypothetical protein
MIDDALKRFLILSIVSTLKPELQKYGRITAPIDFSTLNGLEF